MDVTAEQKRRGLNKRRRRPRTINAARQRVWRDGDIIEKWEYLRDGMYSVVMRRNGIGPKKPALIIESDLVMLDVPRQDFFSLQHQSIAYGYSHKEYQRHYNLTKRAYKVYCHGPKLPLLDYESLTPCSGYAPWIFNVDCSRDTNQAQMGPQLHRAVSKPLL